MPDFEKEFILDTDASDYGIAAVLSQNHNGRERPVGYFSKVLNKAQKNCHTSERELLAIVAALDFLKFYLIGKLFVIINH